MKPLPFSEPLPSVLTPGQLMQVMGLGHTQFTKNQNAGLYRRLEVTQPIGNQRYSGLLVDKWRRGEPLARIGTGARHDMRRSA